ncbi:thermonuclease family protein [Natronococcus jeotgali]|uniref:Nuclease-like protein n=1 Tax=Natronococcus jeotgali DSM 18795 TaxID=1227498 RepID=L9XPC6_9EURY|nr:thermonuclease family protein [Natronococcus jeotgali]ELY63382.1 nuclease-like protein [Natronococcus jeotgali DSM 18795]
MRRRSFLQSVAATLGIGATSSQVYAAASELDCGVWYDAEITKVTDGDTIDVLVDENDTEYNVRVLGHDTPEKSGNTYYEKIEEWEFIDDGEHLEEWGNKATDFAEKELPVGTQCQVRLDCESEEIDQYGRLLAKIRYDREGNGTYDTVYNKFAIEEGYARVYAGSMSNTDEYLAAQRFARENSRGLWAGVKDELPEWRNRDVSTSIHPHTSSIVTTDGKVPPSRVPMWAEPEAVQENTSSYTVEYDDGNLPLVAVDHPKHVAYFGGVTINEAWEEETTDLDHFTFVTNLINELHDDANPSGPVLIDGGHKTFNQDNAVSAEDTAFYQRYLEGVGIELHSINNYSNDTGYALSEARALVASSCPEEWTADEIDAVQQFTENGGVVLLMGSGSETTAERANLDDLAAGIGTDLRLNIDDVRDDTNNVADDRKLLVTENLNREEFDLWTAYNGDSTVATDILDASPSDANTASTHTWTLDDASDDFDGEVDAIDVAYPPGTSLGGLTNENITVYLDRDGDGTTDVIRVNSDEYSGSSATFVLDGRYNTDVAGEVTLVIDGIENPDAGEHVATETLTGDDTYSVDAEYVVK